MEDRKYYVYEWYIKDTGEVFYVGKGCGDRYKVISKRNKFFLDMYNTHDCGVRFLDTDLTEEEAYELEHYWVMFYRHNLPYRLTNQTDGGDGTRGFKPSEEHKAKIAQASKAKWKNPEWRERVIANRHLPDSTYQSVAFKQKISELVQGENNPNYQHYWTDAMKQKASAQRKGWYQRGKNPKAKRVMCVETGEEFDCIADAQEKYNVKCAASFSVALNKPTRTAAGLHWQTIS